MSATSHALARPDAPLTGAPPGQGRDPLARVLMRMSLHAHLRRTARNPVASMSEACEGHPDVMLSTQVDHVPVEPDHLDLLLNELIDNSRIHAGPAARIRVATKPTLDTIVITVADDGPGLSGANRDRIGQPVSRDVTTGGGGMGLSIVARIVDLYGGTVRIKSGLWGQGCFVSLSIPVTGSA